MTEAIAALGDGFLAIQAWLFEAVAPWLFELGLGHLLLNGLPFVVRSQGHELVQPFVVNGLTGGGCDGRWRHLLRRCGGHRCSRCRGGHLQQFAQG